MEPYAPDFKILRIQGNSFAVKHIARLRGVNPEDNAGLAIVLLAILKKTRRRSSNVPAVRHGCSDCLRLSG